MSCVRCQNPPWETNDVGYVARNGGATHALCESCYAQVERFVAQRESLPAGVPCHTCAKTIDTTHGWQITAREFAQPVERLCAECAR